MRLTVGTSVRGIASGQKERETAVSKRKTINTGGRLIVHYTVVRIASTEVERGRTLHHGYNGVRWVR